MSHILRKFPNDAAPVEIERGEGIYLHTADGKRIMDTTSGWTSFGVFGYAHPAIISAMNEQMAKFCHVDINVWTNPLLEELAEVLVHKAPPRLNRAYFSGNSGSEAIEAAMKLSYQVHFDGGRPEKTWFISRDQSFHGATLHGISMSELPILDFYAGILPEKRTRIAQHHPLYFQRDDETEDEYARRSAAEFEAKILEIGPGNVAAFVGETQLGTLVGDVPPAPNYWKYMRKVCDKYDVHLILDEVYCGLSRSGKVFNCSWDDVSPDFICVGKNLSAGFAPLSAVITRSEFEDVFAKGQGRIQHGHTHQGHSIGAAAALAAQKMAQSDDILAYIGNTGAYMREVLSRELGGHEFFRDLRGRGMQFSLEYDCNDKNGFGLALKDTMLTRHAILINAKWHRVSFTPPYIITREQVDELLDRFVTVFKETAATWPR